MDLGLVGRGVVAAIGLRGRCLIGGLVLSAVRGLRRPLYPLTWCSGSGTRRRRQDRYRVVSGKSVDVGGCRIIKNKRMDLGLVGRGAGAANDLQGRCLSAGQLRTALRGLRRPLYP